MFIYISAIVLSVQDIFKDLFAITVPFFCEKRKQTILVFILHSEQ